MTPYDIITQLKSTSGLNDKRAILRLHKDDELFKRVLTYALDPRITFGIKKIPEYDYIAWDLSYDIMFFELDKLVNREVTGNDAIELVRGMLETASEEDAQVLKWIIAKDFKAGFGESLINAEMGDFKIYEVPYMGATSYSPKRVKDIIKKGPAFSDVKMDGRYLNIIYNNGDVKMESRGGRPNPLMGCLESEAAELAFAIGHSQVVFNGELMLRGEKDRYKANGIIASFISIAQKHFDGEDISKETIKFEKTQGISLDEARERIQFVVWDFLPYEHYLAKKWNMPRLNRFTMLKEAVEKSNSFQLVEYRVVHTEAEAVAHFQEMLLRGEEGTILKASNGIWEDKKPTYQCKMKLEITSDLRITGFNYGTPGTKNENVISSINVESMCSVLTTSPGGINEADMKFITENMDSLLGSIVEIKSCGISQDSEGNYSLLHPVFIRLRDDKNTGDDLQKIKEDEAMAKGLTK